MLNSSLNSLIAFISSIFLTINTFAVNPYLEEKIRLKTSESLYFDKESLSELVRESVHLTPEETSIRINEYFSTAPLAINAIGQFFIDYGAEKRLVQVRNRPLNQKHFIFVVPIEVNQSFVRGYVLFLNKLMQDLVQTLEKAIDLTMTVDNAKTNYDAFYNCLQNVALTGDPASLNCLEHSLRAVGYNKPQDVSELANLYIKMYRMSRLAFGTIVTPDLDREGLTERIAPAINKWDPFIVDACKKLDEKVFVLRNARNSITRTGIPGATIGWYLFGGKSKTEKAIKLYSAIPELDHLMGSYFDVATENGYVSKYSENFRKLCELRTL